MDDAFYLRIKQKYLNRDFGDLFRTVQSVADEIGMDAALKHLERCVSEKRLAWLDRNLDALERTGNEIHDGYRIFYEVYLGIVPPKDGEIVSQTSTKLVTRWWNDCPVLDVCEALGLDTRDVCRQAYETPVQVFLSRIHPRLRFSRNYAYLRPHAPYCEEIISLEGENGEPP